MVESAGQEEPLAYSGDPTVGRAVLPMAGAKKAMETSYMDLLDFSLRLGRVGSFDWSRFFGAGGVLLLGAALGALASGTNISKPGVLVCGCIGIAFLLAAPFMRRERIESVQDLKGDLDRLLSYYEHDEVLANMRKRYGADEAPVPKGMIARIRRFWRV